MLEQGLRVPLDHPLRLSFVLQSFDFTSVLALALFLTSTGSHHG